jgi:hypothetical protein
MTELCDGCRDHLEAALRTDDPSEKNYHIREVLQTCGIDDLPEGHDPELTPLTEE